MYDVNNSAPLAVVNKGLSHKIKIIFDFFFFLGVAVAAFMYFDTVLLTNYLGFKEYYYVVFFIAFTLIFSSRLVRNNKSTTLFIFSVSVLICILFFKKTDEHYYFNSYGMIVGTDNEEPCNLFQMLYILDK